MGGRTAVSCAALLCAIAAASPASADLERVALIDADPLLERAVRETLAPWGIAVLAVRPLDPGASMPGSADRARAVAREHQVGAVAWISSSDSGHALWIYDQDSGQVVARRLLSPPPFDEPTASAVALSIKTLLRHSEVAPPDQRYAGAAPRRARRLEVEAIAALELRDTGDRSAEPGFGADLVWWPPVLGGRFGAYVGGRTGAGVVVDRAALVGHYAESSVAIGARAVIVSGRRFAVASHLAGGLRFSALTGIETSGAESVAVSRINPAVEGALQPELRVSPFAFGLRLGGSYLVSRQRYQVGGETAFELPALAVEASLVLRLPLY